MHTCGKNPSIFGLHESICIRFSYKVRLHFRFLPKTKSVYNDDIQVDLYLLPQSAFPTGGLYFKNQSWVQETKGKHVIIHNNYITGFEKKIKRFREFDLWYVDDHTSESPLGRIWEIRKLLIIVLHAIPGTLFKNCAAWAILSWMFLLHSLVVLGVRLP